MRCLIFLPLLLISLAFAATSQAQMLDEDLRRLPATDLAQAARDSGDAARGAVVFFQHHMACSKCHSVGDDRGTALGPDLATIGKEVTDAQLVESVLLPSKVIRKGFESATAITNDGRTVVGIVVEQTKEKLVLRDMARNGEVLTLKVADIEELKTNALSIMPAGQVNQLASQQQFLDLIKYLIEVRDGGGARARELQPSPALLVFTIPEYEKQIDHAGFLRDLNTAALQRGEKIYQRVCANCHGTKEQAGSLPTSLRFAEGKFKNGSDPFAMYQTITRGFGLMAAQTWMVPSQKYDVIHYIREKYLREHNPSQYVAIDQSYLERLPQGNTRGPEPSNIEPWSAMDYGPNLTHTYEIPGATKNFAYKGVAIRLDSGAGGVSRGKHWMLFDTDTLRMAAGWSANKPATPSENFIDWRGIQFNGQHQIHPSITGQIAFANGMKPGWGQPSDGSFADVQRVEGRDGRRYGPLAKDWGTYRGLYHHGQQVILSYTVGNTEILESPRIDVPDETATPLFVRVFNIGPRERELVLQVAEESSADAKVTPIQGESVVRFGTTEQKAGSTKEPPTAKVNFDGESYVEVPVNEAFDMVTKDFTIAARIKTKSGGTIVALAEPGPKWTPDGQTFFVRDGRLVFDIGWVGAVTGKSKINDGKWHDVAVSWQAKSQQLRLYVDHNVDGEGKLAAKAKLDKGVIRIGFTAPNFPRPDSYFKGEIATAKFYQNGSIDEKVSADSLIAHWKFDAAVKERVVDVTGHKHDGEVRRGPVVEKASPVFQAITAGVTPNDTSVTWTADQGNLRLRIPAGSKPLKFAVWTTTNERPDVAPRFTDADLDLKAHTQGGPPRWPQKLTTKTVIGPDRGPFAVDILTAPDSNPWLAQTRFTGLDFLPDGRMAVCTWDGDVWLVANVVNKNELSWQRIATGLFQPLGLKIVAQKIHVTCRDQLVVLHDLNDDEEIDFYQCLNNDHQVTEHFHEFAMGLQTDDAGNFYYAKSGRHALEAVVPQHGTLLRVSPDGTRTDILATGFRAANGVCLNPDGSFVVTDQEGFWNPKNRINWVTLDPSGKPKFYGNLFGYTDVTDTSDAAMVPPLCWITNAFDRSPAELLWVDSKRWGAINGALLNLSYGYGKVFVVPHEQVNGLMQGGMIELPIPSFPTGVMRGRFNPADEQLYLCGMFAWAGNATQPGGLYRIRATGQPMHLPGELHATKSSLTLKFTEPLDSASVAAKQIKIKTWSLKRTAKYGSAHYDEKPLDVTQATLSGDGQTLTLAVPEIQPTWCMEIRYDLRTSDGKPVAGVIHNTIHNLADEK